MCFFLDFWFSREFLLEILDFPGRFSVKFPATFDHEYPIHETIKENLWPQKIKSNKKIRDQMERMIARKM
jgi:hypothetical protein